MAEKILLSRYFKNENIVAREDQLALKPSSKGLEKLKSRLKLKDWEMLYVGDGYDDFVAAKGANVFFAMIVQGLVEDIAAIRGMKRDTDFGGAVVRRGKASLPKFIVAFTYDELIWWFRELPALRKQVKAVCFDLGDTLVVGGREEAYLLTDRNWPTWEVDRLMEESKAEKSLKDAILGIRIENRWRGLASLPAMNSSEARVTSFFLLQLFGLKEKDLVSVLYSEADREMLDGAEQLAKGTKFALNTKTVPEGTAVKDLAMMFPPEQFSHFIAAGLCQILRKEKREPRTEDVALALRSSLIWLSEYRKHEVESYRRHCKVPRALKEFLDLLVRGKKELCIYTSKSRGIVETALAYEKEISAK